MILLDTNALIWLDRGHRRARTLAGSGRRLYISPATLLELQFLMEAGRIRLRESSISQLAHGGGWLLDDPPATTWFETALDVGWTRDPFDRLIVAHARCRHWKLATGDSRLLERLSAGECLAI